MHNLQGAIWVEMLKARRTKMVGLTGLAGLLIPLMGGFFMLILKDPTFARRAGLISAKAQLMAAVADWPTFLDLLAQAIATGGIILFAFIGSWVFGREYADQTVKDLLALPTSRAAIVGAKFVVVIAWSAALTTLVYSIGLGVGAAVGLPAVSSEIFWRGTLVIAVSAALTISLITPIAFFAGLGRGYLPPLGLAILAIVLAQLVAVAGWGEYFPWSIPALYSQGSRLGLTSYLIIILTGLAGLAGTFIWWASADQTN